MDDVADCLRAWQISKPWRYPRKASRAPLTTTGNGGDRSSSTSNDAADPNPIAGLFANAAAADAAVGLAPAAALHCLLGSMPSPR